MISYRIGLEHIANGKNGKPLTAQIVQEYAKKVLREHDEVNLIQLHRRNLPTVAPMYLDDTAQKILFLILQNCNVNFLQLSGKNCSKILVQKRHLLWVLWFKFTLLSNSEIGRMFNRHHSTVTYAIQNFESKLKLDFKLQTTYETLLGICENDFEDYDFE